MTIYFIQAGDKGLIKIGYSTSPLRRIQELALWSPVPLKIIGTAKKSMSFERKLHKRLQKHHSHKEWFRPTYDVISTMHDVLSGDAGSYFHQAAPVGKKSKTSNCPLYKWRKSNNLSQAEAADKLGLSQGFLSKIERGAQVSLKTAVAISQKTKGAVSVESFIQVETAA